MNENEGITYQDLCNVTKSMCTGKFLRQKVESAEKQWPKHPSKEFTKKKSKLNLMTTEARK